jgi:hypothetical protein
MHKLGIIVRADLGSGLQSQTYNLTRMLKPSKVLVINSESFNKREQKYELYDGFDTIISDGFINNDIALNFLLGLSHILTAETFYSHFLVQQANIRRIKTFQQFNWEFLEHHQDKYLPYPSLFLSPSYWKLKEMEQSYKKVEYLPPPIIMNDFKEARDVNLKRTGKVKILHILGTLASYDRNGTKDLLEALKYSKADFELVIRAQSKNDEIVNLIKDKRVNIIIENIEEQSDMYKDFDLMILPRRYGGLCLPMNEALCSGLPVFMSDMIPNNVVLPSSWLIDSVKYTEFMARTSIDVHQIDVKELGERIDWFCALNDNERQNLKLQAYELGYNNYSSDILLEKYNNVMEFYG